MEWKKIENELPSHGQNCIIYEDGFYFVDTWDKRYESPMPGDPEVYAYNGWEETRVEGHQFWMPLPEPPKQ